MRCSNADGCLTTRGMKTRPRLVWKVALVCATGALVLTPSHGQAASIVVTSLADSGVGSFRAAIANANNGDAISFAVSGTITNLTGELVIGKNLAIQGPGPGALAVSGNNSSRVFNVGGGAIVNLSGLTISDGHARDGAKGTNSVTPGWPGEDGGGIYSLGALVVSNCVIIRCCSGAGGAGYSDPIFNSVPGSSDGGSAGNGGGIYNAGNLTLVNCTLTTNTCSSGGNGGKPWSDLPGSAGGAGGNGGGIYDAGNLTITGSTFGFNSAGAGGSGGRGGGGNNNVDGGSGGTGGAGGLGGAIFSLDSPVLVSCTFSGNVAGAGGVGGAGGAGSPLPPYPPGNGGNGGTGGNGGGGGHGGALMCSGAFQAVACTISGNAAGRGGNGGGGGGGGAGRLGPGGNGGYGGSGGAGGDAGGGNTLSGAASLQNVVVAQNSLVSGGQGGAGGAPGFGSPPGKSGIAGSPGPVGSGPDLLGSFSSNGHNLIGQDAGNSGFLNGVLGDLVGSGSPLNPLLGPLASAGCSRPTCALLAGSPAIDAGDDALLGPPLSLVTDERGVPRQIGPHVDIGAFELRPAAGPICLITQTTNGVFLFTLTNLPGATLTVLASTNASAPLSNWNVLGAVSEPAPGQFQFTDPINLPLRFYRVRSP
jgi:hypothetical protein